MARLLSTFGNVLLQVQGAMRSAVRQVAEDDVAPNFYHVILSGAQFASIDQESIRGELLGEILRFAEANEWKIPSRPSILLQRIDEVDEDDDDQRCIVNATLVDRFGRLEISDDIGDRLVDLPEPTAVIGREHEAPPRDFIPLADSGRRLSREHLRLQFDGESWVVEILGRNPTTLNGMEVDPGSAHPLEQGDSLISSPYRVRLVEAMPTRLSGTDNNI